MKNNLVINWIRLAALMFSSVVFSIPYILWTFYVPLQNALGASNAELGLLMTVYGFAAVPLYLFGGYITDRFNPTKLITVSLIGCALLGFYYSTFPSFEIILVIQFLFAVLSIGLYWPALIKATRMISDNIGQGLGFGALEGGRKLGYFVFNAMFISAFTRFGEDVAGLRAALIVIAIQCLVMGVIVWITFRKVNYNDLDENGSEKVKLSMIVPLLKKPVVWIISLIILSVYVSSTVQGYVTSYLVNVFGMGETQSAWFFTFSQFAAPLIVVIGGWLTDKVGIAKGLLTTQILLLITIGGMLLVPGTPEYLTVAMISLLIFLVALYTVRGIYWTLLKYAKIPLMVTGTAIGVISMIAYTPDLFMYNLAGSILDATPGQAGYQQLFMIQLVVGIAGVIMMAGLIRYLNNKKSVDLFADVNNAVAE